MKKSTVLNFAATLCLAFPVAGMALPTQYDYDEISAFDTDGDDATYGFGQQIGGVHEYGNNNESFDLVQELVSDYFGSVYELARVEEEGYDSSVFTAVGYDGAGETAEDIFLSSTYGGWSVSEGLEPGIDFWMVKAGNSFTLWTYGAASMKGYWTTNGLTVGQNGNMPEISHFSAYVSDTAPAPVPEPATMILFGAGLAGLASSKLRKKKIREE